MRLRRLCKQILSCTLTMLLLITSVPAASAEGTAYAAQENAAGGFFIVQNPDGGKTLGYSKDSGVTLLDVTVDGKTYAFKDLNQNGELDPYEDWRLTDEARAEDLVNRLTIEEIAGLMLASYHFGMGAGVSADLDASANLMGSTTRGLLDKGVRAILNAASSQATQPQVEWSNAMQAYAESKPYGIPVNVFSDPRSNAGANDGPYDGSKSSVAKWPGSLGFAATFDSSLVELFGEYTAREYRALGITTALSPQIDLGTEPRWNRINGTFGESPSLSAEMTLAYVRGFQGTYADEDSAWGPDSVATMVKHWPGDGMGEAGRESHANGGKYAVYPGDNLGDHLKPFEAVMKDAHGTSLAAAVMPSYSIGVAQDSSPLGGDEKQLGSGVSPFKMTRTLRGELGYDGLVCTDWGVSGTIFDNPDGTITDAGGGMAWGTGDLTAGPRVWAGIKVGIDMYGGLDSVGAVLEAYKTACEEIGEEGAFARFKESAYRALVLSFRLGLFENPYLDVEASVAFVGNEEFSAAGFDAQLKSIVMLKNTGGVIGAAGEKQTVYIPMAFTPESASMFGTTPASLGPVIDETLASEFFNVVTDEIAKDANPESYTAEDIIPRTDFTGVDFALVKVSSPLSPGDMFSGYGYSSTLRNVPGDEEATGMMGSISMYAYRPDEPTDNGYLPKTLQYREYTADPAIVRAKPIATDPVEEEQWIAAGGEPGMSRYYGGKSTTATNEAHLDLILCVAEAAGDVPVVVAIAAESPMLFGEFEPEVQGILMGFGVSDRALMSIVSGQTEPGALLPLQMPLDMETVEKQMEDVPFDMTCYVDGDGNTYDFGFGLNWQGAITDGRADAYRTGGAAADAAATAAGSYAAVIEGFDWGPGITKLIVALDRAVAPDSVNKDAFTVTEHKKIMDFATMSIGEADFERTVTDAYACDIDGKQVTWESAYIAIELAVSPSEGNPFFYDFLGTGQNDWAEPYTNKIALTADGAPITALAIDEVPTARIMPQADLFDRTGTFTAKDGTALTYASYTPPEGQNTNALIIWLHGAGEGGTDPNVALLGNKVVALGGEEIQGLFGGAYVLTPQAPTMWMDNGEKNPETGAPMYVNDDNFVSIYTEALMELIEAFVAEHPDIDPANIFVGGCSNGGFMTMNMLIHYPAYFRAAYPVCEAYMDAWITDEDIAAIKHIPIWFTYADTDTVVDPKLTAIPTAERLIAAGAEDVHVSGFPNVLDTTGLYKTPDGQPYEYMGHWSWLYTLNNECVDTMDGKEVTIWEWMARMAK